MLKYLALLLYLGQANGQIIHQPAAPVPDIGEAAALANADLHLGSSFFSLPKDTLVGPDDRQFVAGHRPVADECLIGDDCYERATFEDAVNAGLKYGRYVLIFLACASVMACGIIPAILLPPTAGEAIEETLTSKHLNSLLAFSVGSLLGDVFLHVLPEAYANAGPHCTHQSIGLSVIMGILLCFLVEKCCAKSEESQHKAAAIINLFANLVDNFTHGLAVASSFYISLKFGLLTTLAILLHEIPHEISDFAILLRADFNRWSAVKAQLATSAGGLVGAVVALTANVASPHACSHILAFTAGGFINIALVQVLPELMKQGFTRREHLHQLGFVLLGIVTMAAVNVFHV